MEQTRPPPERPGFSLVRSAVERRADKRDRAVNVSLDAQRRAWAPVPSASQQRVTTLASISHARLPAWRGLPPASAAAGPSSLPERQLVPRFTEDQRIFSLREPRLFWLVRAEREQ